MPRASRSRLQLSEEEKKERRREQKRMSLRRARSRMSEAEIEERRKKDRERYQKKKEKGLIKTIKDYTAREQRQLRKIWREKAKTKREKMKIKKNAKALIDDNTPPLSPSCSRVKVGRVVAARNRRKMKAENIYLKNRLIKLETNLAKYRMRLVRLKKKLPQTENKEEERKKPRERDLKSNKVFETSKMIHDFLTQDEHSRLTSGKKETITRKKIKKQIRFLTDSLLNLHKKFVNETNNKISYETFRRNRPFWVLTPKVSYRNTCLCVTHTNSNYIVKALHNAKIISYKSATDAVKSLCCNDSLDVTCLERRCPDCKNKKICCDEYDPGDSVLYERWVTKSVTVVIKGKPKICKKTVKETVYTTKKQLVSIFDSNIPKFMQHVANNIHQLRIIQTLKKQMSPSDGLLHIDFSENYNCKYGQEIQSAHFGGSKPQVSLHTCDYYSTNMEPPDNFVKATSICTITENLRHDPVMICTHLQPVMRRIKDLSPNLKHLHVLSDGPSTQYRNKTMFHLIAKYLSKEFDIDTFTWHYSETGHGKGAPDGVGGCIKRVCDNAVARASDVSNFDALMSCAKINCKGIEVYAIDESIVSEIQEIADAATTRPFKGTLKIHQLTWSSRQENVLHARRLSCLICAAHVTCRHFEIGLIHIQCKMPDTPTNSDIDTPNVSPERSSSEYELPMNNQLPISPIRMLATPDFPTVPNSPKTPETSVGLEPQIRRPLKSRNIILSDDSDDSLNFQINDKRRNFDPDSESDENYNIF